MHRICCRTKRDVNGLTLDMIGLGLDALYEPRIVSGRYESCVICSEKIGIKIAAYQQKKRKRGKVDGFFEKQSKMDTSTETGTD